MMTSLLILAYNEEQLIEKTILSYVNEFKEIIIINDCSSDSTKDIVYDMCESYPNIMLVNNEKNYGAGKSFQIGVDKFLLSSSENLVKIDGDNQFSKKDVIRLKKLAESNKYDFIKSDRFWSMGIVGSIPFIRYIGNIFASLLIKFSTGFLKINDPLNGLIMLSKKGAKTISVPKLFQRYGYPFYVIVAVTNSCLRDNLRIAQIKNTVSYGNEKSSLNALVMLAKLTWYSIATYFRKINKKVSYSNLQSSFAIDIIGLIFLFSTSYQLLKFINIRYFQGVGSQSSWFTLCIIFAFLTVLLFRTSLKIENKIFQNYFEDLN